MAKRAAAAAFLALVSLAVYANSLGNAFCYDDHQSVAESEAFTLPLSELLWAASPTPGLWRPVITLVQVGIRTVAGANPFWFHAVNIAVHAAVVLLLYQLLLDLLERPRVAFAAALLFAVHPLHTEAVDPAVGLMELLAAGFMLAAWILHERGLWVAASACFLLALGSKESAVVLPALVLFGDIALPRRVNVRPYIGYAAALAMYAALHIRGGGIFGLYETPFEYNSLAGLPPLLRAANAIRLQLFMLHLHFWPWPLSADYSPNAIPVIRDWSVLAGWIAVALALLAAWTVAARRSRAILLAGAIYLAGFAVTSNIFFVAGNSIGERWAYFPSIGFCLLLGLGFEWVEARVPMAAIGALCAIAFALSMLTMIRNTQWKNDWAVVNATVRAYPECGRAQCYLGTELLKRGDIAGARQHLEKARAILPNYSPVYAGLASLAFRQGDWPSAQREILAAMRAGDCDPDTATTYAALLLQSGRFREALAMLNYLSRDQPRSSRVFSNRAVLYFALGRPDLARADAEMALRLNPDNVQARAMSSRIAATAAPR